MLPENNQNNQGMSVLQRHLCLSLEHDLSDRPRVE